MRVKYLLYILLFLVSLNFSKSALAQQTPLSLDKLKGMKVNQLTDEQITTYWQQLQDKGMSEKDIYAAAAQAGMAPDEIQNLKDRVTLLGLNSKTNNKSSSTSTNKKIDFSRNKKDSATMPGMVKTALPPPPPQKLQVYGANFFNRSNMSPEPNFSAATPKNYVLGPGDEVIILLTGLNESIEQGSVISPEGKLLIPHAGIVYLNGFTIEQATAIIKNKMVKSYPALKTGQTQLAINLGNTRRIHITIKGEVNTPQPIVISSLASLSNVLYYSGGPNQNGSLRNIQIIRNNKLYKTVDFYDFLQNSVNVDIRLEDQDVINFPVYKKRAGISGEIKRPAIYELKEGETLDDLIKYAGGFTDIAYKGIAKIDQINDLQHEVKDVPANMFSNYIPHNGDMMTIGAVTNRYTNRIVLEGAVYRPDAYELTAGLTLAQLLKNAQGLKPDAYMDKGIISRTMPDLERVSISFVPGDIVNGKNDISLLREDSIMIFNRDVFTSNQKIIIEGFVRKPNVFIYRKGIKLADVIAMAGGFRDEAADHHVIVSRTIKNSSDSVANQLVNDIIVDMSNKADPNIDMELQPMDFINVPRLVNYRGLGNVQIKGEVLFPGDYPVQRRDETVLDFLKRAGGVTPYGSLENTQVYRKGTRVNLDLASITTNNPAANKNMILLPGDSVYVPRVISYVEVAGAVNNPQYISYRGRRFKYYINAAAGTTENALLKGAYIKYPDGLNQPVRHFLFIRNYPKVKPGSKIIVPEKTPDSRFKISLGDISGMAAALTAIVSIIAILHQ